MHGLGIMKDKQKQQPGKGESEREREREERKCGEGTRGADRNRKRVRYGGGKKNCTNETQTMLKCQSTGPPTLSQESHDPHST